MAAAAQPAVDWQSVDAELARVPDDFKDPKFYALKHVVEILSSSDPQGLVGELRDQEQRLTGLVDKMVAGYHTGFAKSIQNYSQILHLFEDSKEQVDSLKKSLADASRQLSAQSRHLQQQWRRSLSLGGALALLDDVRAVADAPGRITDALADKDWPTAVAVLLDAAAKLAREEVRQVGALRKLRSEVLGLSGVVTAQILEELQARVYGAAADGGAPGAPGSGGGGGAGSPRHGGGRAAGAARSQHAQQQQQQQQQQRAANMPQFVIDALAGELDGGGGGNVSAGAADAGARHVSTRELVACLSQLGVLGEARSYLALHSRAEVRRMVLRAVEGWAAAARSSEAARGGVGGNDGDAPPLARTPEAAAKLVRAVFDACLRALAHLGALLCELDEAPAPGTSAALLLLQSAAAASGAAGAAGIPAAHDSGAEASSSSSRALLGGGGEGGGGAVMQAHVWQEMQAECQALLAELLRAPLRGLQAANGASRPASWLSGFQEFGEKALRLGAGSGGSMTGASSGGAAGSAGAPSGSAASAGGAAGRPSAPGGGAASGGAAPVMSKLTFSLGLDVQGLDAVAALQPAAAPPGGGAGAAAGGTSAGSSGAPLAGGPAAASAAASAGAAKPPLPDAAGAGGFVAALRAALGDAPASAAGAYLAPAVYGPVVAFTENALAIIGGDGNASVGASAASTPRGGAASSAASAAAASSAAAAATGAWLQRSVEDFVSEAFLPQVWVDLRGRCTALLEDPEAFRPQLGALAGAGGGGGSWRAGAGAGAVTRPIVPAALFAEEVAAQAMGWVRDMPFVATPALARVAGGILDRVLEALAGAMEAALARAAAGRLVHRVDVGAAMAAEPDAALLGDAMAFYVPRAQDAGGFDGATFLAALKSPDSYPSVAPGVHHPPQRVRGLGLGGAAAAEELQLLAWTEAPAAAEQLLSSGGRGGRLAQLAALCESCEHVAGAITRLAALPGGAAASASAAGRRRAGGVGARGVGGASGDGGAGSAVADALATSVDKYRSLGGACARALRLDLQLLVAFQLRRLGGACHVIDEADAGELPPAVAALARSAARAAEDAAPCLAPRRAAYVFGAVAPTAARHLMWVLQDAAAINAPGAERMARTLALVQAPLAALAGDVGGGGGGGGAAGAAAASGAAGTTTTAAAPVTTPGGADVARAFERARTYYTLVGLAPEEVVRLAAERPLRFSVAEWEALLTARVPGRPGAAAAGGGEAHMPALHRALDKEYSLSAGRQVAAALGGALGEVGQTLQRSVGAPVQSLGDSLAAGIKGGVLQAKALLERAATSSRSAGSLSGGAVVAADGKDKE